MARRAFLACAMRAESGQAERDVRSILDVTHPRVNQQTVQCGGVCFGVGVGGGAARIELSPERIRMVVCVGEDSPVDPTLDLGWLVRDHTASAPGGFARRFVVAGWDELSQTFLLARDPLGLEPVYYATLPGGGLVVATRLLALLDVSEVSREPDSETCAEVLLGLDRRRGATFLKRVSELPRASILEVSPRGWRVRRYATLARLREPDGAPNRICQMRTGLMTSVSKSLRGASNPAVALSGGLDSTSVFSTACSLTGAPVTAITAVFPQDPESWESEFLRVAIRNTGCESVVFEPALDASFSECLRAADDPMWIPTSSILLACAEIAHRRGVDCLITGEFGDCVAGAMPRPISWLIHRGMWRKAMVVSRSIGGSAARRVARHVSQWLMAHRCLAVAWNLRKDPYTRNDFRWLSAVDASVRDTMALEDRLWSELRQYWDLSANFEKQVETFFDVYGIRLCAGGWLAERLIGLRVEHPFADPSLARLAADLDFDDRWSNGLNRATLRRAMAGLIPDEIRVRASKAKLFRAHQRYFQRIRFETQTQGNLWPLTELLGLNIPVVGSIRGAEKRYFEYTAARARTIASWLRMTLKFDASNLK